MNKNRFAALLTAIITGLSPGIATAASYKVIWKTNLPNPAGLISCERTIKGVSVSGVETLIKDRSMLDFGFQRNTDVVETFKYTPAVSGCKKISLWVVCAYKDDDVTEFITGKDISPCRDATATINLYTLSVD